MSRRGDGRVGAVADRCVGIIGCSVRMNCRWCAVAASKVWQVMVSLEEQRNGGGSRQRRILFWTLMRQRVFATAQKLSCRLRLHQPLTFTCTHSGLSHINSLYETFTAILAFTVNVTSYRHTYKPSLLSNYTNQHWCCPAASFIAFTGDRGDLRPSNVMLHCTTRY